MSIKDNKKTNSDINKLYRQLGKEIYDNANKGVVYIKDYNNIINKIDKKIEKLKADTINKNKKTILKPAESEEGIMMYRFCKSCRTGNNPQSTHCIRCKKELL